MEPTTPWLTPSFVLPIVLAVIGGISWLLRLESKVNATVKDIAKIDLSIEESWKDLEAHRTNDRVHFNQRLALEVENRQGDRFTRIERDLQEIKDMVKELR